MEVTLADFPDAVIRNILDFVKYEDVSNLRLVCKRFDFLCQCHLNGGLGIAEQFLLRVLKKVKALLPRRESERRKHALARYTDVLSALETRLSLLRMTYGKYMESRLCCFIPGKVLDELFRVLHIVDKFEEVVKLGELLQELRDISSMAMEHFEDHIAPSLKNQMAIQPSGSLRIRVGPSLANDRITATYHRDSNGEKTRKDLNQRFQKMKRQLEARIEEQNETLEELRARITEQDATLYELQAQVTELLARDMAPKKRSLNDAPSNPRKKRKQ